MGSFEYPHYMLRLKNKNFNFLEDFRQLIFDKLKLLIHGANGGAHSPSQQGTGGGNGLPRVSELVKGRASCHKTLLKIYINDSLTQSKICSVCS